MVDGADPGTAQACLSRMICFKGFWSVVVYHLKDNGQQGAGARMGSTATPRADHSDLLDD